MAVTGTIHRFILPQVKAREASVKTGQFTICIGYSFRFRSGNRSIIKNGQHSGWFLAGELIVLLQYTHNSGLADFRPAYYSAEKLGRIPAAVSSFDPFVAPARG
jgi:hypothetical protein